MDKSKLSPKQAKILQFIETEMGRSGRHPTYRDIAHHCGYEAVGTVQDHMAALVRKGFIERDAGVARGIRLAHNVGAIEVPILGTVPAGRPIEAIEDRQGTVAVSSRIRGELFALKVRGDSMIDDGILEGDVVIVRKQHEAQNGDVVIAMIDGEATVKRFEKKGTRARLLPANPRYAPIEIPPSREPVIQGKVVGLHRDL